jgi:hypothetical protein
MGSGPVPASRCQRLAHERLTALTTILELQPGTRLQFAFMAWCWKFDRSR